MDLITFGCALALALSPVSSVTYSLVIGQLMVATQVRKAAKVAYTPHRSSSGGRWAIRLGPESRLTCCCGNVPSCWKRFHLRGGQASTRHCPAVAMPRHDSALNVP